MKKKKSKNLVLPPLRGLLFLVGKIAHQGEGYTYIMHTAPNVLKTQCTPQRIWYKNMNKMPFLYTFGVRRPIDILDQENHSGSRSVKIWTGSEAYRGGLTPKVWKQKRRPLEISIIFIQSEFIIIPSSVVQSSGSEFGKQNLIRNPGARFKWCRLSNGHTQCYRRETEKINTI